MRQVLICPSGPQTSAIGFGCVGLTALPSRSDALRVLAAAHDAGITHFDTAPAYGLGHSEIILGEFLRGRRTRVTVATKFGIEPSAVGRRVPFLAALKRLLRRVPALDRSVRRTVSAGATMGNFSPAAAARALTTSLRALGTDYIDLWLMHEAQLAATHAPDLLAFLERQQRAGTVRAVGIGSRFDAYRGDCALFPPTIQVFQFENNPVHANRGRLAHAAGRGLITHSVFKHAGWLRECVARAPRATAAFARATGIDIVEPGVLARLLMAWAARDNAGGIVLFASGRADNIHASVAASGPDAVPDRVMAAFDALVAAAASADRPAPA